LDRFYSIESSVRVLSGCWLSEHVCERADALLLSNAECCLALPFLCEYGHFGGRIFATEPVLHYGRLLMEELVTLVESSAGHSMDCAGWRDDSALLGVADERQRAQLAVLARHGRAMYTMDDVRSAVAKVRVLSYGQTAPIGGGAMHVTPHSSGYALGAANWMLRTSSGETIAHVGASSVLDELRPKFPRHPAPMQAAPLAGADVMVLADLKPAASSRLGPVPRMVGELCRHVCATVQGGGTALLPVLPCGALFDLFGALHASLSEAGLRGVPMHFVSPVARMSLGYSDIVCEWLCKSMQDKVFVPEPPFAHYHLARAELLRHYSTVDSLALGGGGERGLSDSVRPGPRVIFAGHSSLRFGDIVTLVDALKHSAKNAIVFTEPSGAEHWSRALAPFAPYQMRAYCCPIDYRLSVLEANMLLQRTKPKHVIVPQSHAARITVPQGTSRAAISPNAVPMLAPLHRRFAPATMLASVADQLVGGGASSSSSLRVANASVVPVAASISVLNHRIDVVPATERDLHTLALSEPRYLSGRPSLEGLIKLLRQRAIPFRVADSSSSSSSSSASSPPSDVVVELPSLNASIRLSSFRTQINADDNQEATLLLRDLLVQSCVKL
jgi:integrator complex subunit 9